EGEEMKMRPRPIEIFQFEIIAFRNPHIDFRVHCSKGTYIRSLAHDVGQFLGCGGYLSALCRTKIGNYHLENAYTLDTVIDFLRQSNQHLHQSQ
ncbi:MAG TPA: tRNA pseudouridine(55) synthase, partial [Chitinophagales bacterium]|nr:tRNA pseudouridine(55) synthase [Chitinophagales bacterium]